MTRATPPRVAVLSSVGANRTSGLGMITALSLLAQGLRHLTLPIAYVRAGGFFRNFLYGLHVAHGGTPPVFYNATSRKSTMVATDDIGAEVARPLGGPVWSGHRVVELGSMISADEVAAQLGKVLQRDVKAFAIPRAGWPAAFEQFDVPKGQTGPAEAMFDAVVGHRKDIARGRRARHVLRTRYAEIHPAGVDLHRVNWPGANPSTLVAVPLA